MWRQQTCHSAQCSRLRWFAPRSHLVSLKTKTLRFSHALPGSHCSSSDFFLDSPFLPRGPLPSSCPAEAFSSGRSAREGGKTHFGCYTRSPSPRFVPQLCPGTSSVPAAILISFAS